MNDEKLVEKIVDSIDRCTAELHKLNKQLGEANPVNTHLIMIAMSIEELTKAIKAK